MANIPNAEISPRIVDGVLKWYWLDTFELQLTLNLIGQDGEPITIGANDSVKVVFRNKSGIVKEFSFPATGEVIENNTVTLVFDATATALFARGQYCYDVYYTGDNRTTLANDNKAVVE